MGEHYILVDPTGAVVDGADYPEAGSPEEIASARERYLRINETARRDGGITWGPISYKIYKAVDYDPGGCDCQFVGTLERRPQ